MVFFKLPFNASFPIYHSFWRGFIFTYFPFWRRLLHTLVLGVFAISKKVHFQDRAFQFFANKSLSVAKSSTIDRQKVSFFICMKLKLYSDISLDLEKKCDRKWDRNFYFLFTRFRDRGLDIFFLEIQINVCEKVIFTIYLHIKITYREFNITNYFILSFIKVNKI